MLAKLKTEQEREAKEQRTKTLMSVFMVAILMMSVISFALFFMNDNSSSSYNKHKFDYTIEGWQTSVKTETGDYYLLTQYHPKDVENIEFLGSEAKRGDFESVVYFAAKTENERAAAREISRNILAQKKEIACLPEDANSQECVNKTVKSCENANNIQKIIVFKEAEGNQSSIEYFSNCVTITGNEYNMIKAADKFIFLAFDIMKQQ